jgi:hypothetical protein
VHDLVVDLAEVAQADDLGALGLEQLAQEALVVVGARVDRAVIPSGIPGRKPMTAPPTTSRIGYGIREW